MENDLSEYEKRRLENIQRNAEFLSQLGLKPTELRNDTKKEPSEKITKLRVDKQPKRQRLAKIEPTRKSSRLLNIPASNTDIERSDEEENSGDEKEVEEDRLDYTEMPMESVDLDDNEFEVYTHLRKWRLLKSRELEIESYKICQNRTLAEMVRRRRNDPKWATVPETRSGDLVQCWGVGPAKAREGGFAMDLAEVLDRDDLSTLLAQSREREQEDNAQRVNDKEPDGVKSEFQENAPKGEELNENETVGNDDIILCVQ